MLIRFYMKIGSQNNLNAGHVYNIERFNGNINSQHANMQETLIPEITIPAKDIERCKGEKIVFLVFGLTGFIADVFGIFPQFSIPWWGWILAIISSLVYFLVKYGEVFLVKTRKKLQITYEGKIIILKENSYVINKTETQCIYPNCKGTIVPINVPTAYKGPYSLMGKCSIAKLQHGYVIDDNLQAYPMDIYALFNEET